MRDETELIRAAAAGDRRAFADLVRAKRERVVRTALQITGDLDDAMDVAQAVFVKLWRDLARFDASRTFDTWLHRVTANAAIDAVRSRASRAPAGRPIAVTEVPEIAAPAAAPEASIDRARLAAAFRTLAARLAPRQRAAFVLREIDGHSTAEVARILDVTESTVRNHLLQARRILREGLEREYPDLVPASAASAVPADREDP